MKAIAFNGSPRKRHNTGQLLEKVLDGAASQGWDTELVSLYDHFYSGCISCFACKTTDGPSYGKCILQDDLTSILERVEGADMLVFGSPLYFGTESGRMRAFLERLLFPYHTYAKEPLTLFPRKIKTAFIYTSGVAQTAFESFGVASHFTLTNNFMARIFGHNEQLFSSETKQFENPENIFCPAKDIPYLEKRHAEVFPQDLQAAYDLGLKLAQQAAQS